jgi:hypothetical protein
VIAWLGDAPKQLGRLSNLFDQPANSAFQDDDGPTDHIFFKLLQRSWWTRTWVIQELILAQDVKVQCGDFCIPWSNFVELVNLFWTDVSHAPEVVNARDMAGTRERWQKSMEFQHGLLSVAWQFRAREAGDARDKLYALHGLTPKQSDSLITPDYTKSPEQVFRSFAQAWINRHTSLLIMNLAQRQLGEDQTRHPTWYPVWSEPFQTGPEFFCGSDFNLGSQEYWNGKFSADANRLPPSCIHPVNKDILCLRGFTDDTVMAVATRICKPSAGKSDADWRRCMADWKRFVDSEADQASPQLTDTERIFYLTITAGLVDSQESLDELESNDLVRRAACAWRRLFITERGSLGLGPASVSQGDKVCVLFGSSVPIILSECTTCQLNNAWELVPHAGEVKKSLSFGKGAGAAVRKRLGRRATMRFVGDVYVHDIMECSGTFNRSRENSGVVFEDYYLCG